jgi:hypothetical protein
MMDSKNLRIQDGISLVIPWVRFATTILSGSI